MLKFPTTAGVKYNYYNYYQNNKQLYKMRYQQEKQAKEKEEYIGNYYRDYWKQARWQIIEEKNI